jgi:hypothetical protein
MFDLRSFMIGIILMLRKFTCIDIKMYAQSSEEDYKNGVLLLPLIGLAIGLLAFLIMKLRIFYDEFFISAIVLAYYSIITKTVNMKDTYRTLNFIIKPKNISEQISGTIGIVIIYIFYLSTIRLVAPSTLIVLMVSGYSGLIILSTVFQRDKGDTSIIKYCGLHQKIFALATSFLIAAIINYKLVVSLALTYMISGFVVATFDKKAKILPTSIEGFMVEVVQIVFLITTYFLKIW